MNNIQNILYICIRKHCESAQFFLATSQWPLRDFENGDMKVLQVDWRATKRIFY